MNKPTTEELINKLPEEIKVSKPERIRIGGRKVHKIIPLEQTLTEMYKKWYITENEEEPDMSVKFSKLDEICDFFWDVIFDLHELDKDLMKVVFDKENILFDADEASYEGEEDFIGFHTLPNKVEFLGFVASGDWEHPLYFIVYHDGKKLRGYIPTNGNTYNTIFNTAFGSEYDTEKEDAPEYDMHDNLMLDWAKEKGYLPMDTPDYEFILLADFNLMLEDIENRIVLV